MDLGTLGMLCWPLLLQVEWERDVPATIIYFFLICTEFVGASESWVSCPVTDLTCKWSFWFGTRNSQLAAPSLASL